MGNVWTNSSPYGTYEGERGNPRQWREGFFKRFTSDQIETILGEKTPYSILGISENVSDSQIKSAYRKLMLIYHPDKPTGDRVKCDEIMAAYQKLID